MNALPMQRHRQVVWNLSTNRHNDAKRKLALNLEKVNDDRWPALLNDEKGRKAKDISDLMASTGLEQWTPEHTA